jgi:hypothetical protein
VSLVQDPDFTETCGELRCDGGGWTGCASFIEGGIGDRVSDLRRWAKEKGWKRKKADDGKYYDFCPACAMNT